MKHTLQIILPDDETYHRICAKKHQCGCNSWIQFINFICDSDFILPNGKTTSHKKTSYIDINDIPAGSVRCKTPQERAKMLETQKKLVYILNNADTCHLPEEFIRKVEAALETIHVALQGV